jgi:putative membrane protein
MYEWIKALHVIAVIAWMAGMLYLPRLFVYHCEAEAGSKQSETFKVMERRLLKAIINPAMVVSWLAGLYLAWAGHWLSAGWFHGKLLLVLVLSGVHGLFSRWVKDFAADRNTKTQKVYRIINEIPTALMIGRQHFEPGACLRKAGRFSILLKSHPTQADVVAFRFPR